MSQPVTWEEVQRAAARDPQLAPKTPEDYIAVARRFLADDGDASTAGLLVQALLLAVSERDEALTEN